MEEALRIEGATLSNIADGKLERQFQEQLAKVVDIFSEAEQYEHTSDVLTVSIPMVCEFYRHADTGVLNVAVRAQFKPPKLKRAVRAAYMRAGTIVVEVTKQEDLFTNVRPLRGGHEGGEK